MVGTSTTFGGISAICRGALVPWLKSEAKTTARCPAAMNAACMSE